MMPSPATIDVALISSAEVAERDDRAVDVATGSGRKIALSLAASRSLACVAMRSITVARSSVDDRSRPTSDSADDSRARAALRLVEEAGVLERHAHRRRHRGEQPHRGLVEGMLTVEVFQSHEAQHALAADDGHHRDRLAPRRAGNVEDVLRVLLGPVAGDDHGALAQHALGRQPRFGQRIEQSRRLDAMPVVTVVATNVRRCLPPTTRCTGRAP